MAINSSSIRKLLSGDRRDRPIARRRRTRDGGDSVARRERLARIALISRLVSIGIVALVVAVLVGVQLAERDEARAGVRAWGVDLGGMTRDEARAALADAGATRTREPLRLVDGERSWETNAGELGLTLDVDRALDEVFEVGRSGFGPSRLAALWHLRSDPYEVGVEGIAVRGDELDSDLQALAAEIYQEKVDPVLSIDATNGVVWTPSQVGRSLDVGRTRADIMNALASGRDSVPLTIDETMPAARDEEFAAARAQLDKLFDAPIEVVADGEVWTLTPSQIANWMTVAPPANGQPAALQINETWVDEVVWDITLATDRAPRSPRVWWDVSGSLIQTSEGSPGKDLDADAARAMLLAVFLGQEDANRVELPVASSAPPSLPADMASLGISSRLASSSTPYGGGLPERMHNIELAAKLLNGTLVLPGQTFSFNAEIGPMTLEAGFQMGYGIAEENGELKTIPAEAGGICQVATTVFQPVFWTGYDIVQRGTHSYWIPNYTYNGYVGLDAAVEPAVGLDFQWTNNSSTAVLIETATDGQNFTVNLYGTPPTWRVEIDEPVIENVVAADQKTVYQPSSTIPDGTLRRIERAQDGFDAKIVRRVINGDNVSTLELSATYGPSRNVILVGSESGELPDGWTPPSN